MERSADMNKSLWIWTITVQIISQNLSCVCKTTLSANGKKENGLFNNALITFYLKCRVLDIWLRIIQTVNEESHCHHFMMSCSIWLAAKVLLYAPSHRQNSTQDGICYTSCDALAGMRNLMRFLWVEKKKTISYQVWCLLFWVAVAY